MTTQPSAPPTGAGAAPPRWVVKAVTRLHVFLNRLTGGRLFNRLGRRRRLLRHHEGREERPHA